MNSPKSSDDVVLTEPTEDGFSGCICAEQDLRIDPCRQLSNTRGVFSFICFSVVNRIQMDFRTVNTVHR